MANDKVSYGWAGKMARVNLTTGDVTVESSEPYQFLIGGMGLGKMCIRDRSHCWQLTGVNSMRGPPSVSTDVP